MRKLMTAVVALAGLGLFGFAPHAFADERQPNQTAQERRDVEKDRADVSKDLNHDRRDDDRTARRDDRAVPAGTISGRLIRGPFLSHDLKLREPNGKEFVLKMDDRTRVLENGREVQLKDFKEGTEVRASFGLDKDHKDRIARDVIILHPARR